MGERERFRFRREGGEGRRGRLRGEEVGGVAVGSGWGSRPRHRPYRFQIGNRLLLLGLRGWGSSGGRAGVGVGVVVITVSWVGVRSR